MISTLIEAVQSFADKLVLVVGDYYLDGYVRGDADRISPEAPVPVLRVVETEYHPGGSGSVVANLAALGVRPICCGLIGRDANGEKLVDLLEDSNADLAGIIRTSDRSTTVHTRYVGLAQHRHPQQLMRVDEVHRSPMPEELRRELCRRLDALLPDVDVVCIADSDNRLLADEVVGNMIASANRCGVPVLVDPAPLSDFDRYRGATFMVPNRSEFCRVSGHPGGDLEGFSKPAVLLRDTLGLEALIITVDRDGVLLVDREGRMRHIATRVRPVYDNTGASQATIAMLAAALAGGTVLEDAVRLANIAGGLEVQRFGNVPVARDEVLSELRMQSGSSAKTRTERELLDEIALRRSRGQRIVFTNGCFDLLHYGHHQMLVRCKALGDVLIVAVNSDASVRLNKGPDRPICHQEERAGMLAALECVDYVTIFDAETPLELIKKVKPDLLAKGGDYEGGWVCGREFVEENGGAVVVLPLFEGYSTTDLVTRIRSDVEGA